MIAAPVDSSTYRAAWNYTEKIAYNAEHDALRSTKLGVSAGTCKLNAFALLVSELRTDASRGVDERVWLKVLSLASMDR